MNIMLPNNYKRVSNHISTFLKVDFFTINHKETIDIGEIK